MSVSHVDPDLRARELETKSPAEVLRWALSRFANIAISFSGAEDVVLVDMAAKIRPDVPVFTLDTGRLHPETYRFLDKVREHYNLKLEVLFPEAAAVEELVRDSGFCGFYTRGHKECCAVRKVAPLRRKLNTLDAWITGQRRDQSQDTRAAVPVLQTDTAFSTPQHTLVKLNPLAGWNSEQVWHYIRSHNVPYNELHARGFVSIGCEPCTRAVLPNQHEREGRWWWESAVEKECGLHADNVKTASR